MVEVKYRANLLQKTIALGSALLCGKDVGQGRMKRRMEVCAGCPFVEIQGNAETGLLRCGICKCKVKSDKTLINLARYEETNRYGCKHPEGSQWKKAGV